VNRTDRLYALTEELRRAGSKGRSSQYLAEQFEVSVRTIKRDVAALQQAGTPIWTQAGPGGGYVLDAAATLPPVNLTPAQAVAVASALAASPSGPFATDGATAYAKIVDVMDPDSRRRVEELASRVWVRQPTAKSGSDVRSAIDEAVRLQRVVVLEYVDAKGQRSRRRVEPMELSQTNDHWYLVGWCLQRDAVRWFRLDRVSAAHLTPEPVTDRDLSPIGTPPADAGPVGVVISLDTARRRR
jgi:predicted DNA-binding transcriptional regulator YafY